MRRVREVLRLRHALGMSDRSIAQSLAIGKTTVGEYICRAKVIGITWPVPEEIDREIARLKLETMGVTIDRLTEEQAKYLASWDEGT